MNGVRKQRVSSSNVHDLGVFEIVLCDSVIIILFETVSRAVAHVPYCGFDDRYSSLYFPMVMFTQVDFQTAPLVAVVANWVDMVLGYLIRGIAFRTVPIMLAHMLTSCILLVLV